MENKIGITIFIISSVLIVSTWAVPFLDRFENFSELYKPVRENVCGGKSTKPQLDSIVDCIEQFRQSFNFPQEKVNEMKPIVEACFPEGEKDVNIELDKEHREIVYLMCSNNFAECVHKQKPKYQPPGQTETQPKPDVAEKIEAFIKCQRKSLNID
ncbi:hypothetical protein BLOT_002715 [Blomia tropicalis]|nr:hypothetical protein BLOT_002715 [Blomia tropicalis]